MNLEVDLGHPCKSRDEACHPQDSAGDRDGQTWRRVSALGCTKIAAQTRNEYYYTGQNIVYGKANRGEVNEEEEKRRRGVKIEKGM